MINSNFLKNKNSIDNFTTTSRENEQQTLSPEAVRIQNIIVPIFTREDAHPTIREIGEHLRPILFRQLQGLAENCRYSHSENNSHLSYELRMMNTVIENEEVIRQLLVPEDVNATIPELPIPLNRETVVDIVLLLILFSDIGKMGWSTYEPGTPQSKIGTIFNHVFFFDPHRDWMKAHAEDADLGIPQKVMETGLFNSCLMEQSLHIGQQVALESVWAELYAKGLDQGKINELFQQADALLPKSITTYPSKLREQITNIHDDNEIISRLLDVKQTFSLTKEEIAFLTKRGLNPKTTTMGAFFTKSHIAAGPEFVKTANILPKKHVALADIAACHHLSQGEIPPSAQTIIKKADESILRLIGFTEILDKFDALVHRGAERNPKRAWQTTENIINSNLDANSKEKKIPSRLKKIYQQLLKDTKNIIIGQEEDL